MNKRQKKKLDRKLGQKSYYRYRQKKINRYIDLKYGSESVNGYKSNLIYIVDSKRMDLKHPKKITLFTGVYPASIGGYSNGPEELKLGFSVRNNTTSEEVSKVTKMLITWNKETINP